MNVDLKIHFLLHFPQNSSALCLHTSASLSIPLLSLPTTVAHPVTLTHSFFNCVCLSTMWPSPKPPPRSCLATRHPSHLLSHAERLLPLLRHFLLSRGARPLPPPPGASWQRVLGKVRLLRLLRPSLSREIRPFTLGFLPQRHVWEGPIGRVGKRRGFPVKVFWL